MTVNFEAIRTIGHEILSDRMLERLEELFDESPARALNYLIGALDAEIEEGARSPEQVASIYRRLEITPTEVEAIRKEHGHGRH